jgi:hypothetical protein
MKSSIREIQNDILKLKNKINQKKPSNSLTDNDIEGIRDYIIDNTPRLGEVLHNIGNEIFHNEIPNDVVEGKIEPDIENPAHKKFIELSEEYKNLILEEFEKLRA